MPTRYSHWTFGKAYHKMKTQYDYNLGRIYEMVINSDPCYAFFIGREHPDPEQTGYGPCAGSLRFF
ncbi:MAG: SpoVR family protein [Candidatus Syntrophopropionicum ammoniitolerans]